MDILVDAVTAGYRHRGAVLSEVTLGAARGEQVALIGPSGAGKTTLFRLLTRSLRPSRGRVVVGGADLGRLAGRELRSTRASIGVIHQRGDLVPSVSALANVAVATQAGAGPLAALRLAASGPTRDVAWRCREALDRLEVGHLAEVRVDELSGGQRQRVAVARLLVQAPSVVLADEPTASVDQASGDLVMEALVGLALAGAPMVIATHELAVARRMDRVVALADGVIVHNGAPTALDSGVLARIYMSDKIIASDAVETPEKAPWSRPACR